VKKLFPFLSATLLAAFAIVLVNCGNDSHPLTATNQFALIREAVPAGASISAAQRHLPTSFRHLPVAQRRALMRVAKPHQGTGLKPLAVEISPGTDSVVIMNNDGTGEAVVYNQGGWFYSVHMGYDGKHGVATAEDLNHYVQVYYADLTDKNNPVLTQLTTEQTDHYSAQLSWDNKTVAYLKYVEAADYDQTAVISSSGGTEKVLSTTFDIDCPTFAPNGKIVFGNDDDGTIYIMNGDGTGIEPLITRTDTQFDGAPSVSPDGKTVAFERCITEAGCDVWTANIDGSSPKQITNNGQSWDPMFINNKIVFVMNNNGNNDIYSMDSNGQNQKQLTTNPAQEYFDWWWW
jgi:Tol biopolymer transport system component